MANGRPQKSRSTESDAASSAGAQGLRSRANQKSPFQPRGGALGRTGAAVLREERLSSAPRNVNSKACAQSPASTQEVAANATKSRPETDEEVVRRQPREVPRWYSVQSQGALSQLAAVETEVLAVQARVEELAALPLDSEEQRSHARTELAQLEAQAHKLECQGVDNVYTNELESGKADAKDLKKALLARLEKVLELIDKTFHRLKDGQPPGKL